jgi:hypothetical protein
MTPAAVLPGSLERWYHLLSQEPCLSRFMVLIGFAENAPEIRSGSPFEVSLRRLHVRMLEPILVWPTPSFKRVILSGVVFRNVLSKIGCNAKNLWFCYDSVTLLHLPFAI